MPAFWSFRNLNLVVPCAAVIALALALCQWRPDLFNSGKANIKRSLPRIVQPVGPSEQEQAATAKICDALRELRVLNSANGASKWAQTPFEFLGLDPQAPPFTPLLSSDSLGPKVQSDVEQIVTDAAVKVRNNLWQLLDNDGLGLSSHNAASIRQHISTTYLVTAMIVDEPSRLMYLSKVHPKLKKWDEGVKTIDSLCGNLRETAWEF